MVLASARRCFPCTRGPQPSPAQPGCKASLWAPIRPQPLSPEPQTTAPAAGLCKPRDRGRGKGGSMRSALPPSVPPPPTSHHRDPLPASQFTTQAADSTLTLAGAFENQRNATSLPPSPQTAQKHSPLHVISQDSGQPESLHGLPFGAQTTD